MKNIVIRPNDYNDLKETISEKNIINSINGKEYVVNSVANTILDERTLNPNTLSQIYSSVNGEGTFGTQPKINRDILYNFNLAYNYSFLVVKDNVAYCRNEALFYKGSFEFDTQEPISDFNSIVCDFTINFRKSNEANGLDEGTYNRSSCTIIFRSGFPNNGYDISKVEIGSKTNEFIEAQTAKATSYPSLFGNIVIDAIKGFVQESESIPPYRKEECVAKVIEQTSTNTRIRVDFNFRIWSAWVNQSCSDFSNKFDGAGISVDSITIKTMASTSETHELDFVYKEEKSNIERDYQLETNELMQRNLSDPVENSLSYKTFEKIKNNYDEDRRIVTFDLINPLKVEIDDTGKYTNGKKEKRYLDTDDEFSLYNEHNKYVGDFKVIQSNPIWDGSYHKIITAMLDKHE